MPVIWNNKVYMLVADDSEWDQLEFVVARKLHIKYEPTQVLSIDLVKKSFEIYGKIEKIEIFRDSKDRFVHVTFKESRPTYFVLIDFKQNPIPNIELIRPADANQQPDNLLDASKSCFYSLPDKCLIHIFGYCNIDTVATLSVVCKKICQLLRDRVLANKFRYEAVPTNDSEINDALITATRLIQCVDPAAFDMKIFRNLTYSHDTPTIAVNFVYTEKSKLSIDMSFLKTDWLSKLGPISKRIRSIHVRCTIYDKYLPFVASEPLSWSNTTILTISGFSMVKSVPDFSSLTALLPNLETISIRDLFVNLEIKDYCYGKHLRTIDFQNCSFKSDISQVQISDLINVVTTKLDTFPLCVKIDRIRFSKMESLSGSINQGTHRNSELYAYMVPTMEIFCWHESSYDQIEKALEDENTRKYIRIQIGKDVFLE